MRARVGVGAVGVPADEVSGHREPLEVVRLEGRFAIRGRAAERTLPPGLPAEGCPASIERVGRGHEGSCHYGISAVHAASGPTRVYISYFTAVTRRRGARRSTRRGAGRRPERRVTRASTTVFGEDPQTASRRCLSAEFGLELGGGARVDDAAVVDDVGAVGKPERHRRVLLDEQEGDPLVAHLLDHRHDVLDDPRGEPLGRLVHEDQTGVHEERAGDRDQLGLPAREMLADPVPEPAEDREALVDPLERPRPLGLAGRKRPVEGHFQVPLHGQGREDAAVVRDPGDAAARDEVGRHARDVRPVENDPASPDGDQAEDALDRGRLPAPVPAEEADRLARLDLEREPAQDLGVAVEGVDPLDGQQGRTGPGASVTRVSPAAGPGVGREPAPQLAEIRLAHLGVLPDRRGRALRDDAAPVQHRHVVGQGQHEVHVVLDHHDA